MPLCLHTADSAPWRASPSARGARGASDAAAGTAVPSDPAGGLAAGGAGAQVVEIWQTAGFAERAAAGGGLVFEHSGALRARLRRHQA